MKEFTVPQTDDCSEGQLIYRQWLSKQITDQEYCRLNAQMGYALLHQDEVMKYPNLPKDLEQYVSGRLMSADFNYAMGVRLGSWADCVQDALQFNTKNKE